MASVALGFVGVLDQRIIWIRATVCRRESDSDLSDLNYQSINLSRTHDWAFYADDPKGALGGGVSMWCFWWNENYQKRFEKIWGPDADAVADDLADKYAYIWPWFVDASLAAHAPNTFAHIEHLLSDEELISRTNGTNPATVLHVSILWGAFHVVRKRRSWPKPKELTCPICDKSFWGGDLPIWTYRQFGPARYCQECCLVVRNGKSRRWKRSNVIQSMRTLADSMDSIPNQSYSFEVLAGLSDSKRDAIMSALWDMPNFETIKAVLKVKYWLNALQEAGLVGEAWRPSRGTWCIAADGHRCRSLLEKSIDDWFSRNGFQHECEPYWPAHSLYNPSGKKRADWRLADGSFVECIGMMGDNEYAKKIQEKQMLAEEVGIKLYLVSPTDLVLLDKIFENALG